MSARLRRVRNKLRDVGDIWLFVQIFLLITILPVLIRWLSFPRLLGLITPGPARVAGGRLDARLPRKLVRYTDCILRRDIWIYRSNCLKRSLVLYHFLRRFGFDVRICFGVKSPERTGDSVQRQAMQGHAWLVWQGKPVLEPAHALIPTYTVTFSYPESDINLQTGTAQLRR